VTTFCAVHTSTVLETFFVRELQVSGAVTSWLIAARTNL
jgi:hypothetical protein